MPPRDGGMEEEGLLLAIDIGNSQVSLGLGDDRHWLLRWRLASDTRRTADEYAALLSALLESESVDVKRVARIVLSSVVPELGRTLGDCCLRLFGHEPLVVGPGIRTGLALRYDPPSALGSDRLVDAVAARARFGAPVIVVDFGTATTFNVVDAGGTFIGGAIAPGVKVAASALAAAGARLNRIDLSPPDARAGALPVVGKNTEQSMRSGILRGYAGLVDGMLARILRELQPETDSSYVESGAGASGGETARDRGDIAIIATGGMAPSIAPLVPRFTALVPDLVLDGLRIIEGLNRDERHPIGLRG